MSKLRELLQKRLWKHKIYRKNSFALLIYPYTKIKPAQAKIEITCRYITKKDQEELNQLINRPIEDLLERIEKGHIGTCATHENKIVAITWAAPNDFYDDELLTTISLPENFLYGYDAYTHPEYRKLGIHQELTAFNFKEFQIKGYDYGLIITSLRNTRALAASNKGGAFKIGEFHSKILFGFNLNKIMADEKNKEKNEEIISTMFKTP